MPRLTPPSPRSLGRAAAALSLAALAACGSPAPPPGPLAAEIVRAVLVVHRSDGALCVALTPLQSGGGTFRNCPGLAWQVTAPRGDPALARALDGGWALLPDAGAPLVVVTGADGRRTAFGLPG
jgi:hypothetical protein